MIYVIMNPEITIFLSMPLIFFTENVEGTNVVTVVAVVIVMLAVITLAIFMAVFFKVKKSSGIQSFLPVLIKEKKISV